MKTYGQYNRQTHRGAAKSATERLEREICSLIVAAPIKPDIPFAETGKLQRKTKKLMKKIRNLWL